MNLRKLKKIILIRHGETEGNINPEVYTKTKDKDVSLTKNGHKQAIKCGVELKNILTVKPTIYCSPFKRARQTLKGIGLSIDISNVYEAIELHEKRWELFNSIDEMNNFVESDDFKDFFYRNNNGESLSDMSIRIRSFIKELMIKDMLGLIEEEVVIVAHWWVIVAFQLYLYNLPYENFHAQEISHPLFKNKINNAEIIQINIKDTIFYKKSK